MSLRDRGTIKWNSIMLPEHVEALKAAFAEDERKEKPILDEQQRMEMDAKLKCVLQNDLTVEITYFKKYDYHKIKGKLLSVDMLQGHVRLDDDSMTTIEFENVLNVTIL